MTKPLLQTSIAPQPNLKMPSPSDREMREVFRHLSIMRKRSEQKWNAIDWLPPKRGGIEWDSPG